jgi:GlpG protein
MAVTSPSIKAIPNYLSYTPVLASPIQKEMMYDYPLKYELADQLIKSYGLQALKDPENLPPQGQQLIQKYLQTPHWTGIYEKIVNHFQNPESAWNFDAPMFEKIRQGEMWRLFTPCLLHAGIFHLFFNMAWLVILGKQMEQRMGKMRYLLFIVIGGVIPNTAQYLMSGPDFLGFSGVLCAMIAYIWVRQKKAAWEGYQLQAGTISFITFFILLMLGIQLVSFIFEIRNSSAFAIGIANTAHLVGAAVGYLLGRLSFFSWQARSNIG